MGFTAKFPSRCANSGDDIRVGDDIERDEHGGYSHVECLMEDLRERFPNTATPVCTSCWIEKPCQCDDEANAILDRLGL